MSNLTTVIKKPELATLCADAISELERAFEEEYYEFLEMALAGNYKWARIELVQSIAMLLRIYCHLAVYVADSNKAITQSGNNAILQEVQP